MVSRDDPGSRPAYVGYNRMEQRSSALAEEFARQILTTTTRYLTGPSSSLDVLDVGSGYGATSIALAPHCRSVVGLEPTSDLHRHAAHLARGVPRVSFEHGGVETLDRVDAFDLVVLDNVYEHVADQLGALDRIDRALRPGGVVYLLTPNRRWPIEAHYRLPFLSWLPLGPATRYLRWSGRGTDFTDASYARTYWTLRRHLARPGWDVHFTLPGAPAATFAGSPPHYRAGWPH